MRKEKRRGKGEDKEEEEKEEEKGEEDEDEEEEEEGEEEKGEAEEEDEERRKMKKKRRTTTTRTITTRKCWMWQHTHYTCNPSTQKAGAERTQAKTMTEKKNHKGEAILKQVEGWARIAERLMICFLAQMAFILRQCADVHFCARVQVLYLTVKVAVAPSQCKRIPEE